MTHWTPTNRRTDVKYLPVTDAEKAAMEADPMQKGKYTFKVASGDAAMDVSFSHPKKSAAKATVSISIKPEKEKLVPMGVDLPEEPKTEKELPQA